METIQIACETEPLTEVLDEVHELTSELRDVPLNLPNRAGELLRIETLTAKGTGKVTVRFYPSESLTNLLATLRARKREILTIE